MSQRNPMHWGTTRMFPDEVRQVFEIDDFGPALTPALREQDERLRAQGASR